MNWPPNPYAVPTFESGHVFGDSGFGVSRGSVTGYTNVHERRRGHTPTGVVAVRRNPMPPLKLEARDRCVTRSRGKLAASSLYGPGCFQSSHLQAWGGVASCILSASVVRYTPLTACAQVGVGVGATCEHRNRPSPLSGKSNTVPLSNASGAGCGSTSWQDVSAGYSERTRASEHRYVGRAGRGKQPEG